MWVTVRTTPGTFEILSGTRSAMPAWSAVE